VYVYIFKLDLHVQRSGLPEAAGVGREIRISVPVQGRGWVHWSGHWQCPRKEHQMFAIYVLYDDFCVIRNLL